jgi:hypothetical protein
MEVEYREKEAKHRRKQSFQRWRWRTEVTIWPAVHSYNSTEDSGLLSGLGRDKQFP